MPTMAEKILSEKSGMKKVSPGDVVEAVVDWAMSHEGSALVMKSFSRIGVEKVWNSKKIVIMFDHRVPAESERTAESHKLVREFVKKMNIEYFYDIKEGICHQIMPEKGHVAPGELIVGTDSHTTTYGAFGAFGTGIGATDMAGVWASGRLWLKVPESIKISISGKVVRNYLMSKDVILHIIGEVGMDGAEYKSVEFHGDYVKNLSVPSRMTLTNLSAEMGAKAAFVPTDEITDRYIRVRAKNTYKWTVPDDDSEYVDELRFDVSHIGYTVACPHQVDNVRDISEVGDVEVDQALIGSCTNGRTEDIEIASKIVKGKKVCRGTRFLVIPASREVYLQCLERGYIHTLVKSGAVILNPGCGPCLGAHQGLLASGEVCVATTSRNFRGRMGSRDSRIYLASPAVVAASAVAGKIVSPEEVLK